MDTSKDKEFPFKGFAGYGQSHDIRALSPGLPSSLAARYSDSSISSALGNASTSASMQFSSTAAADASSLSASAAFADGSSRRCRGSVVFWSSKDDVFNTIVSFAEYAHSTKDYLISLDFNVERAHSYRHALQLYEKSDKAINSVIMCERRNHILFKSSDCNMIILSTMEQLTNPPSAAMQRDGRQIKILAFPCTIGTFIETLKFFLGRGDHQQHLQASLFSKLYTSGSDHNGDHFARIESSVTMANTGSGDAYAKGEKEHDAQGLDYAAARPAATQNSQMKDVVDFMDFQRMKDRYTIFHEIFNTDDGQTIEESSPANFKQSADAQVYSLHVIGNLRKSKLPRLCLKGTGDAPEELRAMAIACVTSRGLSLAKLVKANTDFDGPIVRVFDVDDAVDLSKAHPKDAGASSRETAVILLIDKVLHFSFHFCEAPAQGPSRHAPNIRFHVERIVLDRALDGLAKHLIASGLADDIYYHSPSSNTISSSRSKSTTGEASLQGRGKRKRSAENSEQTHTSTSSTHIK